MRGPAEAPAARTSAVSPWGSRRSAAALHAASCAALRATSSADAVAAVGLLTYAATGFPEPYQLVDAVMGTGLMASWWVRDPIFATLVAFSAATVSALVVARGAAQDAAWSAPAERREPPGETADVLAAGASAGPRTRQ